MRVTPPRNRRRPAGATGSFATSNRPPVHCMETLTPASRRSPRTGSRRMAVMTDRRLDSRGSGRGLGSRMHEEMTTDLEALRRESARHLRSLESFRPPATRRRAVWEDRFMATFGFVTRRPWASTAIVGVLTAIAALVVPFSYDRVTGHE